MERRFKLGKCLLLEGCVECPDSRHVNLPYGCCYTHCEVCPTECVPPTIDSFRGKYSFLSNFYRSPFVYAGFTYPTVEHAYQASKALARTMHDYVAKALTPAEAKRRGRQITMDPAFEANKVEIMRKLLEAKFSNPDLRALLLATHPYKLIEGNNWGDHFWGVCNGHGENKLGNLLMELRSMLK